MPGFFLSIILTSLMLMSAVVPQNTIFSNVTFTAIFLTVIVYILWKAISKNLRNNRINWHHLILTSLTCSIIAAFFFSAFSFIYARDISPGYLQELLQQAKVLWIDKNYTADALATQGEWTWLKTPINFAVNNFKVLMLVLAVFSVILSTTFYFRYKNNHPYNNAHDPQLIF